MQTVIDYVIIPARWLTTRIESRQKKKKKEKGKSMIEIDAKCGCSFKLEVIELIFLPGSRDIHTTVKKLCKKHAKELSEQKATF